MEGPQTPVCTDCTMSLVNKISLKTGTEAEIKTLPTPVLVEGIGTRRQPLTKFGVHTYIDGKNARLIFDESSTLVCSRKSGTTTGSAIIDSKHGMYRRTRKNRALLEEKRKRNINSHQSSDHLDT